MPTRLYLGSTKTTFSRFEDPFSDTPFPGPTDLDLDGGLPSTTSFARSFSGGTPSTSIFTRTVDGGNV